MKTRFPLLAAGLLLAAASFTAKPAQAAGYCREYTRSVTIGNRAQDAYGTACQQPDGSWKIVSENGGDAEGRSFVLNGAGYNNVVYVDKTYVPPPRVTTSSALVARGPGYFFSYNTGVPYYRSYYRQPTRIVFYDRGRRNGWHGHANRGHDNRSHGRNNGHRRH
jgi:surface antigen